MARRRLALLVLIMTAVAVFIAGTATGVLYNTASKQKRTDLFQTAQSQVRLMEAVVRHDQIYRTTSKAGKDVFRTYGLGLNSFIMKPASFEGLVKTLKAICEYRFQIVGLSENAQPA